MNSALIQVFKLKDEIVESPISLALTPFILSSLIERFPWQWDNKQNLVMKQMKQLNSQVYLFRM